MSISCTIIPGTAFVKAPAINAAKVKELPLILISTKVAAPHTILPASIDVISEQYIKGFFEGRILCIIPETAPYVASSNAILTAVGKNGGIPRVRERNKGAIKPTASPQGQPQTKPHSSTGICKGQSFEPISGICPVRKGIT